MRKPAHPMAVWLQISVCWRARRRSVEARVTPARPARRWPWRSPAGPPAAPAATRDGAVQDRQGRGRGRRSPAEVALGERAAADQHGQLQQRPGRAGTIRTASQAAARTARVPLSHRLGRRCRRRGARPTTWIAAERVGARCSRPQARRLASAWVGGAIAVAAPTSPSFGLGRRITWVSWAWPPMTWSMSWWQSHQTGIPKGGVVALSVHGVGGDDHTGKVQAGKQRLELRDLIGCRAHLALGEHGPVVVVQRSQQVDLVA